MPDRKLRESVEAAVGRAFERADRAAQAVEISVTVNATVANGADAYETGRQIGAGIASRLKQRGVPIAT